MTAAEAVAKLDALSADANLEPEGGHVQADKILLAYVPADVRAAYERVQEQADGWWYA